MRAVFCLVFVVACAQAATQSGSAFSFLSSLFGSSSSSSDSSSVVSKSTSEWPYVQYKTSNPRQSPVDVITSMAVTRDLPTLEIVEPDLTNHTAKFYNSGHTMYVYMSEDEPENKPQVRGGPLLNQTFYFEQMCLCV